MLDITFYKKQNNDNFVPCIIELCDEDYEKLIVWLYESRKGGERAIIGKCVLRTIWDIREDISYCFTREILEKACVTYDLLKSYAPNYVWEFSSPVSLPSPVPLSAIGMTRPPQSWQYLTDEQAAILERRLA